MFTTWSSSIKVHAVDLYFKRIIFDLNYCQESTIFTILQLATRIKMAKSTYGTLQEFKPECEPITAYLERVKAYFDANDVPTNKRVAVLLSIIGPKTYAILRSLMAPDTPQSKSLETLTKALEKHYNPKPIIIAERYHFHLRKQQPSENVTEYIAELRRLAASCEFGAFLE